MTSKTILFVAALAFSGQFATAQDNNDVAKAIDGEQYGKAEQLAQNLVKNQASAENYFLLGKAYLLDGNADSAKIAFNLGIAADGESALDHAGLGAVNLLQAQSPDADFTTAIGLAKKKDEVTRLFIGEAYIHASKPDYQKALTYLEAARAIDKKNADVLVAIGDAYHGLKKNTEAYNAYTSALELEPNKLRAKLALGVLVKESRAFVESEKQFKEILAADADYAPAYRELAETYYLWANSEPKTYDAHIAAALAAYKNYVSRSEGSLDSKMRYADFLILAKDYKTLEQVAKQMAFQQNQNRRILRYLGYSAYQNGNYPDAEKALTQFIADVTADRVIGRDYLYLGLAQLKGGQDSLAVMNMAKAVAIDSTLYDDIKPFAKESFSAKNYGKAADLYELVVNDPLSKTVAYDNFYLGMAHYFDYATRYRQSQDSTKSVIAPDSTVLIKADTAFAVVTRLSPNTPDAWLYRARINRLLDDQEDMQGLMVPYYEKYIELVTATPGYEADARLKTPLIEAYSNLGAFEAKSEDKAEAKEYFNKVLALDPQNKYATSSLEYISQDK